MGLNKSRMVSTSDAVKGTKAALDLPAWKHMSPLTPPAGIEPANGWTGDLLTPIALAAATGRGGTTFTAIARRSVCPEKAARRQSAVIPPVGTGASGFLLWTDARATSVLVV
jgi:hypothetical protein